MQTSELARRVAVLEVQKKYHAEMAEMLGGQLQELKRTLYELFAEEGLEQICVSSADPVTGKQLFPDGQDRILTPSIRYKGHSPEAVRANFHAWLREHGFGALIKESVNDKSLSSWIQEHVEHRKALPPNELLTVTELESVTIRRASKGRGKESQDE